MRHGIASSVHAVMVLDGVGREQRLVLKICVRDDPTERDQAGREAAILQIVAGGQVAAPRLVAVDREGEFCGRPSLLMTRLEGQVILRPRHIQSWIRGLAELLPQIHSVPAQRETLEVYATYGLPVAAAPPPSTAHRAAWEEAIARVAKPAPEEPACFIHRDLHPGNVLWAGSRTAGVVDWLHACWGSPAADLGHCRWNLWYLHGQEAADAFLREYRLLVPGAPPYDPYWDLAAALGGNSLKFSSDARSLAVAEEIVYSSANPRRAPSRRRT